MIAITGIGAVTALGLGVDVFEGWLRDPWEVGESRLPVFPRGSIRVRRVPELPRPPEVSPLTYRRLDRASRMGFLCARETLASAGLSPARVGAELAVCLGGGGTGTSTTAEMFEAVVREGEDAASPFLFPNTVPNAVAGHIGILLGATGPSVTVADHLTGGEVALIEAGELLLEGGARYVLCGSVSEANSYYGTALSILRCLARESAPAGPHHPETTGAWLGEGAGMLLLETVESAGSRGAAILAHYRGGVAGGRARPPGQVSRDYPNSSVVRAERPDFWFVASSGAARLDRGEQQALRALMTGGDAPQRTVHGGVGFLIAGGGVRAVAAVLSLARGIAPATVLTPRHARPGVVPEAPRAVGVVGVGDGGQRVMLAFGKERRWCTANRGGSRLPKSMP